MVARAPRPAHLAELPALGQGSEMGLDPVGGDRDYARDALAGESGEAAHGVEDGPGDVTGLGRLAGEPSPAAGAGTFLRARTAGRPWRELCRTPPADRGGACPRMVSRERSRLREPLLPVPEQVSVQVLHPGILHRLLGRVVVPLDLGREQPGSERHPRLTGRVVALRRLLVVAGTEAAGRAAARGARRLAQRLPG